MGQDDRDDAMLEERLSGRSVQIIARQHHCAIDEVEAVIDRRFGGERQRDAVEGDQARRREARGIDAAVL